jgi:hypothetical protein
LIFDSSHLNPEPLLGVISQTVEPEEELLVEEKPTGNQIESISGSELQITPISQQPQTPSSSTKL